MYNPDLKFEGFSVYVDPLVVSFTATPAIAEIGSTVDSVVLKWSLSKAPLTLKFNGVAVALNTKSTIVDGPFTDDQQWTLTFTDQEKSASGRTKLQFLNKAYWANVDTAPASSADVLALENSDFVSKRAKTIQYGVPNGKKPCFAYPARLGAPRVQIGTPNPVWGSPTTIWSDFTAFTTTTVSVTNPSGFTENYNVVTFNAGRTDDTLLVEFS